jgi:hypothetical protein
MWRLLPFQTQMKQDHHNHLLNLLILFKLLQKSVLDAIQTTVVGRDMSYAACVHVASLSADP